MMGTRIRLVVPIVFDLVTVDRLCVSTAFGTRCLMRYSTLGLVDDSPSLRRPGKFVNH